MIWFVIGLTIVVLVGWAVLRVRGFLDLARQLKDVAGKDLEASLKRRQDGISDTVQALKAEAGEDEEILEALEAIERARDKAASQAGKLDGARARAEDALSQALGQGFQAVEKKESVLERDSYLSLRSRAIELEDDLTSARDRYNRLVVQYNIQRSLFPINKFIANRPDVQAVDEFNMDDAFSRYPLKLKLTLPTGKRRLPGVAEEKPTAGSK